MYWFVFLLTRNDYKVTAVQFKKQPFFEKNNQCIFYLLDSFLVLNHFVNTDLVPFFSDHS